MLKPCCRLQIQRVGGLWYWAEYSTFTISDEAGLYQLTVDGYSGDAGDAMTTGIFSSYIANARPFTTIDSHNDECPTGNCAIGKGGWWFGCCATSYINSDGVGIWIEGDPHWDTQATRMLVKPNF